MIVAVLLQVLTAPDPSQMEKAPDLGYVPTPHSFNLPNGLGWDTVNASLQKFVRK